MFTWENALIVIDRFDYEAPKTSRMLALLDRLDVADQKVLVLTDGSKPMVFLSGRNLPNVHVMPYGDVSTYHLLWSDLVLVEATALGQTLAPVAEAAASASPKKAARSGATKADVKGERKADKAPLAKKVASKVKAEAKSVARKAEKPAPKKAAGKKPVAPKKKGK